MKYNAFFFFLPKEIVAEEGDYQVGRDESSFFIDEGDSVGVSIEKQAYVAMVLDDKLFYLLLVACFQRIRLVAWEGAVENVINIIRCIAEEFLDEQIRCPVAAVDGYLQIPCLSEELSLEI